MSDRPFDKRGREVEEEERDNSSDKIEGRNAVTEALAAGRDFNKICLALEA